ncbi:uncharacterized protein LOC134281234 isoform X2 [Saccostrea cucullata]|uniref:uncharacterized protein LOC134249751 n=1 Tax=Saccostrea cuccullata TaxID=36930 RepID=UPI002ED02C74
MDLSTLSTGNPGPESNTMERLMITVDINSKVALAIKMVLSGIGPPTHSRPGDLDIDSSVQSTRYMNMKFRPFMLMMIQLLQLDGRMIFHPFQQRAGQESLVENKLT